MPASSLYRQWRPKLFSQMVGQEHVVTTLKNAVIRDQVAHAYIFAGPRGTGKTTAARLLAKAVNCEAADVGEDTAEPCNDCSSCLAINEGNAMSVVEMDAASHRGIDDIRQLQERVPYASTSGRFRVYILDEAHMLTPEAFNALLKTLEEPPEHVIFILATTEPHKIPVTIQSRCQRFDFRYLTVEEVSTRLKQVVESQDEFDVDDPAVWAISAYAEGAVRDALSLLEQCRDYATGHITEEDVRRVVGAVPREVMTEYARLLLAGDIAGLMQLIEEVSVGGADMGQFIRELLSFFRDLLLFRASGGQQEPIVPQDFLGKLRQLAGSFALDDLLIIVDRLAETEDRARYAAQPRFLLEMSTIRLAGRAVSDKQRRVAGQQPEAQRDEEAAPQQAAAGSEKQRDKTEDSGTGTKETKPDEAPARAGGEGTESETDEDIPASAVASRWNAIMNAIHRVSLPAHALLQPARPGPVRDGMLYVVFDDQFSYHRDRTQEQNRKLVEEAAEKVFGRPVTVRCVLEGEEPEASQSSGQAADAQSQSAPHTMETEPQAPPERSEARRGQPSPEDNGPPGKISEASDCPDEARRSGEISENSSPEASADGSSSDGAGEEDAGGSNSEDGMLEDFLDAFDGRVVGRMTQMDLPAGSPESNDGEPVS